MAFADEVMELTTGTEKHLQPVEMEEDDERKTRNTSADSSTITTTNTSSSSSLSSDEERVTIENLEVRETAEKETGFHGEHDDVNNGNVYLDGEQGSDSSDAESDHESQTVDHLKGEKKVTEFEKGSPSEDNKGSHEIDEVQDGDIPEEVEVIEEEVDIDDVKDYKAKEVLENQETPHLLCPKCKSCITKVVVLKKRVLLKKKIIPKKRKESLLSVTSPSRIKVIAPEERKESIPNMLEMPVSVTRRSRMEVLCGLEEVSIPGSFFYKCLSCFSIFERPDEAVGSNPVPPSEGGLGINPQLKPPQEPTGCSTWIVSMLGIKDANQPRDNPTPLVVAAAPTEASPPVQGDAVTNLIQVPDSHDRGRGFNYDEEKQKRIASDVNPQDEVRLSPIPPPSGTDVLRVYIPPHSASPPVGETPADPSPTPPVVEGPKPEILKSIVYGGLTEAITSLGVISSAAGSGASTLNILVLGLANLFSGLILIIHNLQELRGEEPIRETTEDNQTDGQEESRYKRLLGRREHFLLHASLAILSFIITGLLPPVVYYFSFREEHNKDYKVASVFGASLICIVLLALAKAHVRNPRGSYLKSVLYYATNAVSVSGITYVVGNVVNQLLEKYGWSDGSETPAGEMMISLMGRKAGGFGYSSSY